MVADTLRFPEFRWHLPKWLEEVLPLENAVYPTVEDRMRLVIELSRLNVQHGTGGPFGAGVFDQQSGKLLAPGVNLVMTARCSILHAEIVAIAMAQQLVQHYDLSDPGLPPYELVVSTEPCAMCLGAVPWSGVRALVCGARDEDARAIGFDEGTKPPDWVRSLESRGVSITRDVRRAEAVEVLEAYRNQAGVIYNTRRT